ncbi:MAG: D-alanyl-D-alanine carboxypeptidase family protein, partial [Bacillota bacterium]|nr:D-alanyl-D-alanine carboxypeptidase family protein [Bacillota bacterium]
MMKIKKMTLVFLLLMVLICFTIVFSPESKIAYAYEMDFESKAALLMEYHTGEILVAYNEHEKLFPASITKVMTVLLALEALDKGEISLTDEVPITQRASSMGGSQIFLSAGDVVDMESLLIGMVVASGNDAAVAVAEYLAGSVEAFAERMNQRAAELGMKNTNFVNPNGLHDDDHYSTAYDIALMSREIITYPIYSKWSTIWMDENFLEGKIKSGKVYLSNTNKLIRFYQDCDGIKTGYTSEAGHSISATAERNETRFIAIVLNTPSSDIRYEEARSLLNYGFANYYNVQLANKHEIIKRLFVDKG